MPTRSSSLGNNVSTAVDREIGSQYDNVKVVAENIESVVTVADHIDNVDTVATNIVDVHAVGGSIVDVRTVATNIDNVVAVGQDIANINTVAANVGNIDMIVAEVIPNIDEISNASANAAIATTKANEAAISAASALVSEQNAKASELAAGVSEGVAITKAAEASASAIAAHNSELAAAAILDAFDDRYLGSFVVDPVTDNDGQPLLDGTLYFNTSANVLKVYDVGTTTWYTLPQTLLSSLLDVQLTSTTVGDMLSWNGTKWVNTSSVQEHITDMNNPHSVTKAQVGLENVDNTADVDKNVLSATKWATARTVSSTGDVTWEATLDGSVDATGVATLANSGVTAGTYNNSATAVKPLVIDAKGRVTDVGLDVTITPAWSSVTSTPTTLSGYGIVDAYTKTEVQTALPKVGFDLAAAQSVVEGQLAWNATERTLDLGLGSGVVLQVGQEQLIGVQNNTGSTITNLTVCMYAGSIGNSGNFRVAPFSGTDVKKLVGVATEDILDGGVGFVTTFGKIRGVDTRAWSVGAILYLGSNGSLTSTVPTSGLKVAIAVVISSNVNGTIFVRANIADENAYEPANANIQTHIASTSNPHSVTKTQVGLSNVDNTADNVKNVATATKWATARTLTLSGDVSGSATLDGSADATLAVTVANDSHTHAFANVTSRPTTVVGYGITDAYTKTEVDSALVLKVDDTEIASVNLLRADKYLAAQNIANMTYVSGDLAKIQYNTATDVNYETLGYTSGNLTSINHYVGSVLKGTTTLSYTAGNLTSAVFVGV